MGERRAGHGVVALSVKVVCIIPNMRRVVEMIRLGRGIKNELSRMRQNTGTEYTG